MRLVAATVFVLALGVNVACRCLRPAFVGISGKPRSRLRRGNRIGGITGSARVIKVARKKKKSSARV